MLLFCIMRELSDSLIKPKNGCPYVFDDEMNLDAVQVDSFFHVMHINIRSYIKNETKLKMMLDQYLQDNLVFDVILICESFITLQNLCLVNLPGYQCYNKNRETRQGGGIMIFVRDGLRTTEILSTPFNDVTESLFVNITFGSKSLCVGEIYRVPNSNLGQFEKDYCEIFNSLRQYKRCCDWIRS